jgi:spore maturation protein CgeB
MTPPLRVFGVDYQFLSCGDVFTRGLLHAAEDLGLVYQHSDWAAPDLERQIVHFRPDLLFVVHGRKFSSRWSRAFEAMKTAVWLLDEPYEVDDTARFSQRFQHVFLNDPSTLHRHHHATYLPVCYDPRVHADTHHSRSFQVGFVGGGNRTRDTYLAALARAGVLGYVIGGAWSSPEVNRLCVSRNVTPRETAARYNLSRVALNVFRETHHFNQQHVPATSMNPRVYEAFACGALVVSEWRPEADTLVPQMPVFRSEADCVAVVMDVLANPDTAEAIRLACWEQIRPHTYAARLRTVLETCHLTNPQLTGVSA